MTTLIKNIKPVRIIPSKVGSVSAKERGIYDGSGYDFLVSASKKINSTALENGNVNDTVAQMKKIVAQNFKQVEKLSQKLKICDNAGNINIPETTKNIYNFIQKYIRYRVEKGEKLRTPARTWQDAQISYRNDKKKNTVDLTHGADCDCMSIFCASICMNLHIPCSFRIADYGRGWQHVYTIIHNNGRDIICDPVHTKFNEEKQTTNKKDFAMSLNGVDIEVLEGIDDELGSRAKRKARRAKRKAKRKERRKKKGGFFKRVGKFLKKVSPTLAISRGAFLAVLALNFRGFATRLQLDDVARNKMCNFWEKMGGKKSKLESKIKKASTRKAIFGKSKKLKKLQKAQQVNGVEVFSDDELNLLGLMTELQGVIKENIRNPKKFIQLESISANPTQDELNDLFEIESGFKGEVLGSEMAKIDRFHLYNSVLGCLGVEPVSTSAGATATAAMPFVTKCISFLKSSGLADKALQKLKDTGVGIAKDIASDILENKGDDTENISNEELQRAESEMNEMSVTSDTEGEEKVEGLSGKKRKAKRKAKKAKRKAKKAARKAKRKAKKAARKQKRKDKKTMGRKAARKKFKAAKKQIKSTAKAAKKQAKKTYKEQKKAIKAKAYKEPEEVEEEDIETPEVEDTEMETPEVEDTEMETPEAEESEVETPEVEQEIPEIENYQEQEDDFPEVEDELLEDEADDDYQDDFPEVEDELLEDEADDDYQDDFPEVEDDFFEDEADDDQEDDEFETDEDEDFAELLGLLGKKGGFLKKLFSKKNKNTSNSGKTTKKTGLFQKLKAKRQEKKKAKKEKKANKAKAKAKVKEKIADAKASLIKSKGTAKETRAAGIKNFLDAKADLLRTQGQNGGQTGGGKDGDVQPFSPNPTPNPDDNKSGIGKKIAIGAGILAVGGTLIYFLSKDDKKK